MKLTDEAIKQRAKLEEKLQQANKIEYLYSIEEFHFFLKYLTEIRDEIAKSILNGKLLEGGDQRKEDFNKGGYHYLNKMITLNEVFSQGAIKARKDLEKFDKAMREISDEL